MSVLDMFASALGAFIMVSVILFPYYQQNKPLKAELDEASAELIAKVEEVKAAKREASLIEAQNSRISVQIERAQQVAAEHNKCKREAAACMAELANTFLLVGITWKAQNKRTDVDLHVTDPDLNEFDFFHTNRSGTQFRSEAQLSTDSRWDEGVEVWQVPRAAPGKYKIEYVLNEDLGEAVKVSGFFFDKGGKRPLPDKELGRGQMRSVVGTIEVEADGQVRLH